MMGFPWFLIGLIPSLVMSLLIKFSRLLIDGGIFRERGGAGERCEKSH